MSSYSLMFHLDITSQQCDLTDMLCGGSLTPTLDALALFYFFLFFLKRQTTKHNLTHERKQVLLRYLNAISLNQNIYRNYNMYQIVW